MRGLRLTPEQYAGISGKKQPRIKNVKRKEINGIGFDSTKEARRYQDLMLMQQAGQIFDLRRQVPYEFHLSGVLIFTWYADFVYREKGERIVCDVKGWRTEVYLLKKKIIEAYYGFKILET